MKDRRTSSRSQRVVSLEEENEKILKSLDIDNYKLSRIPRPDEE
jgi:hypothetical protein